MGETKNRIIKNTFYLYIRSIFSLALKLYTSRLVLLELGVENFGVYQLIGGLVGMFSFLNSTMAAATQRFISYEIGLGKRGNVSKMFSSTINIHIIFGIIIFILIEIIGQILVQTKLEIGSVDTETVKWVLHFTALSTVLTVISVPYNGLLISKEDMKYFAYIDLFGVFLQFIVALLLTFISSNKLIYYSFLMFLISAVLRIIYSIICAIKYSDIRYKFVWDTALMKRIFSFSSWTTLSAITYMVKNQGVSVILNAYLGPIVNAAVGIGNQVNNAIKAFSQNFQMSFMPQIVKNYAGQDFQQMNKLIVSGAKLSTILLVAISVPVMLECDNILHLWLKDVPPNTSIIVILILIETIFQTMTCTGNTAIRATGNVRRFEVIYNSVELVSLPCILLWLYLTPQYYVPFIVFIIFIIASNFVKVGFLKRQIPLFSKLSYIKEIFFQLPLIVVFSVIIPIILKTVMEESFIRFCLEAFLFESIFIAITYIGGLNKEEKQIIKNAINLILKKWN